MNELQNTHKLLKEYGCEATFPGIYPEMRLSPYRGGVFFYRPNSEIEKDHIFKEWREVVSVSLDVCLKTKKSFAPFEKIRFDIDYSANVNLYSMYVSLPTTGRSTSLSHERYRTEELVMKEIKKWISKAGCKRTLTEIKTQTKPEKFEQLSLF